MSMLDKILNAQTSNRNPYFVPGEYVVVCEASKIFTDQEDIPRWVFEGQIESFEGAGKYEGAFIKGNSVSTGQNLMKRMGPGHVKQFAVAAYKQLAFTKGEDPNAVTEEHLDGKLLERVTSEADNVAVGLRFRVSCQTITKKNGDPFDKVVIKPALGA